MLKKRKNKILIDGGAGFIGSNFIHYWLKNHPGDEIFNLDKLTYCGNLDNLKDIEKQPNYHFIKGDICNKALANKVLKDNKIEIIVHFAAASHVDRSIIEPDIFVKTNVLGTQILLDAAVKNNIRHFHHISTDEVFGSLELSNKRLFNEESPIMPNSPYAASKASSDCLVRAYNKTYGLFTTITNTSNNFGPCQFPEKLIPLVITNLLENKKVPVYGDGKNVRDWIYVEDHCRAIDMVLRQGKSGETYCIGGGNEISNINLVRQIAQLLGKDDKVIKFVKDRAGHDRRYGIDSSKAKRELGFEPLFDFEEYLKETIWWYKNNRIWWNKLKKRRG